MKLKSTNESDPEIRVQIKVTLNLLDSEFST